MTEGGRRGEVREQAKLEGSAAGSAKPEVRTACLERRDCMAPAERARRGALILANLTATPEMQRARTVMSFATFRTEVDTLPLIGWCRLEGKRLALPRVTGRRTMELYVVTDGERDLAPSSWGIPEPVDGLILVAPEEVNIVIVPGSAFDRRGGRLGYGGGFYDTYMRRLRPGTPRVAICYACQLCEEVPMEPHDLRMDALVTEEGVERFG